MLDYYKTLFQKATDNSQERLLSVNTWLEKLLGDDASNPYGPEEKEVVEWMFRLHKANDTSFYSLFKDVMRDTELDKLEGLEAMSYFVGNFFDDSGCILEIEPPQEMQIPIKKKENGEWEWG